MTLPITPSQTIGPFSHEAWRWACDASAAVDASAGLITISGIIRDGDGDTTERLRQIAVPALVIAGELDAATPLAMSETIALRIPGARLNVIAAAWHLSAIEQPDQFRRIVRQFMLGLQDGQPTQTEPQS